MTKKHSAKPAKPSSPIAGLLAWILPGMGHVYLGHRARGITIMIVIALTFWCGVAIGGVKSTVDPKENRLWFLAQVCTGAHSIVAAFWSSKTEPFLYVCPSCDAELPQEPISGQACPHCNKAISSPTLATQTRLSFWPQIDIAIVYSGIAGLLNVLVILDAIARAELEPLRERAGPSEGSQADG